MDEKKPKEFVQGTGPFTDALGNPSVSGNTLFRKWRTSSRVIWPLTIAAIASNFVIVILSAFVFSGGPITINRHSYENIQKAYQSHPEMLVFILFPLIGLGVVYTCICFCY